MSLGPPSGGHQGHSTADGKFYDIPLTSGGVAVITSPAAGTSTAVTISDGSDVTEGSIADAAVSTDSAGTVNAHLRGIVKLLAAGISTTEPVSSTATAPSQTTIGTSALTALAVNATRKGLNIQNQGTTVLKILLGSATPTQSNYTVALPACITANDGSSPPWYGPPGVAWTGAVQWISSASGGLGEAIELT